MERTCTKCCLQKPIEEFGWKNRLIGKRHAVCKECTAKRSNDWYQDNKDRQKENVRRNNQYYREQARQYVFQYLLEHAALHAVNQIPVYLNSTMKVTRNLR